MSTFEQTLATALHDESREISMSVDMSDGYEIVEQRMDSVDRRRRVWTWVGVAAAVAAVVVAAVLVRPAASPAGLVEPASGPEFRTTQFQPGFTANLPAWVAEVMSRPTDETADTVTWNRCEGEPVCIGLDAYTIRHLERDSTQPATYDGYLTHLEGLRQDGAFAVTDSRALTVDGRPATVLTMVTVGGTADGMGCFSVLRCQDFYERNVARYAVIDTGGAPLVIGMRTFSANPQGQQWIDQLEGMLATMRLSSPDYPTTRDLVGTYAATVTPAAARRVLGAANLEGFTQRILEEASPGTSGIRLELYVDTLNLRLYVVDSEGRSQSLDEHSYELVDGRITGTLGLGQGRIETVVLDVAAVPGGMQLTWIENAGPDATSGIPQEAYERALYTAATWVRSG